MPYPKKWVPVVSFITVAFLMFILSPLVSIPISRGSGKLRYQILDFPEPEIITFDQPAKTKMEEKQPEETTPPPPLIEYKRGTPKPIGETYTKTLIIPRTKNEDVAWLYENFGGDTLFRVAIHEVDNTTASLHPPKNKGHEVMVYLTYMIDHYHNLSDVNIFMHSHRQAWHNDELLEHDAVQMISRLSSERVQREGYMNLRCSWDPGCPDWMHPDSVQEDINKQEETMLARSWSEIFPSDPIPRVLAQPCCAQFAISRERIHVLPISRYVFFRDWLLRTSLSDYISGRVWEYIWQFVFTGQNVVCPVEHVCYCDGFGVCFGGAEEYQFFYDRFWERQKLEQELASWEQELVKWKLDPVTTDEPEVGKDLELKGRINGLTVWCAHRLKRAREQGDVEENRAKEAGREWNVSDEF